MTYHEILHLVLLCVKYVQDRRQKIFLGC